MTTDERLGHLLAALRSARTLAADSLALGTLPPDVRRNLEVVVLDLAELDSTAVWARFATQQHNAKRKAVVP